MPVEQREVAAEEVDLRLDRWFKRHFPTLGHGRLEKLLRTGQVRVDGKRVKAGQRLEPGQVVRVPPLDIEAPAPKREPSAVEEREAKDLRARVLHKDAEILVIDKPAGLAVQGGTGTDRHLDGLLEALRFEAKERPRLVHRLDRDTSGVLVLARTAEAARWLGEAFKSRDADKVYWAVVAGVPKPRQGRIDLKLAKLPGKSGERVAVDAREGKHAVTDFAVVEEVKGIAAWVALKPLTGRTHQLRAHLQAIGHPILGDGKYGGKAAHLDLPDAPKQLQLHARSIALKRPNGRVLKVEAPLPPHLRSTWAAFGFSARPDRDPFGGERP
ncbi:MAG: RluA family pseudouridine synthase [Alphaproteobacteria bacterium]|nr:RluA family pseudouridine synthase [Alphaproteobacteria bacterium]